MNPPFATIALLLSSELFTICSGQFNSLFRYIDVPADYDTQVQACREIDSTLASIRNDAENRFVLNLIRRSSLPMPAYLGGRADGQGNWQWEDGSPWDFVPYRNDGLAGTGETRLAYNPNDATWHDWNTGEAELTAICRRNPAPTVAPTTSVPTMQPTVAPTVWYEHDQVVGDNITALQRQVNALSQGTLSRIDNIAGANAVMAARISTLEQLVADQAELLRQVRGSVESTRATILSAVTSFSSINGAYDVNYQPSSASRNGVPSVESLGADMRITAPSGSVKINSNQCTEVDPCRSDVGMNAIAAAMDRLRDV